MPRIRTIKPDFWKSEKVGLRLPGADGRQARLLFIGLLNFAEDHGVCRGNPSFLRSELFGYEEDLTGADVERWLDLLEAGGFIVRFERGGSRYIWITGFEEHQKIDKKSRTTFPKPTPEEIEHSARARRGLGEDSPLEREEEGDGEEEGRGVEDAASQLAADAAPLPTGEQEEPGQVQADRPEDLQAAWNELTAPPIPRWVELGSGRREKARARLAERPLATWRDLIARIARSDFCRGENDRGWVASPDFLLQRATAAKVLEGNFDNRAGKGRDFSRGRVGAEEIPKANLEQVGVIGEF